MSNSTQPLVSICIPSYNHSNFIAETIASVILQDYQNIELLIIDDCSKDNSVEIINNFAEQCKNRFLRFEYRQNEKNKGISYNLNQAIKWANGKYFYAIASDDILMPHKTSLLVKNLENLDENYAAIFGDALLINENSQEIYLSDSWQEYKKNSKFPESMLHTRKFYKTFLDCYIRTNKNHTKLKFSQKIVDITYQILLVGNFLPAMSSLIKLEKMREVNGYSNGNCMEDFEMWLKLLQKYKFCLLNEPVAYYRWHKSNTAKTNTMNLLKDELFILGAQKNFAIQNNCKNDFYYCIAEIIAAISKNDFEYAKHCMNLYKVNVNRNGNYFNYTIME